MTNVYMEIVRVLHGNYELFSIIPSNVAVLEADTSQDVDLILHNISSH